MKTLSSVVAAFILLAGVASAHAQRTLPEWNPRVEPGSAWKMVNFTDEAGYQHMVYCRIWECWPEAATTQANLYELTLIDSKDIKDGTLYHYSSVLSAYVMTRPKPTFWESVKGVHHDWKITKPGDAKFSTSPSNFLAPVMSAPNTRYLVMAPTTIAKDGTQRKAVETAAAAEKERLAKEAAAKGKKEKEERERQAAAKKPEPGKDQPAASNDLTPFEIVLLKAGENDPVKAAVDKALKAKGTKDYDNFVAASKTKVMDKAKAYVHPSWQPKNPNAPKVLDRFDPMEQDYIKERLKDLSPNAQATFDKQLEAAAKDPKKAEAMVSTYRSLIKEEVNLYVGSQGSKLSAREQLDRMSAIMAKVDGATSIEEASELGRQTTEGKGSDQTVGKKPTDKESEANEKLPPGGKTNLANNPSKKGPLPVPSIGKDGGEDAKSESKFDTKLWVRRIGSTALAAGVFAIIGSIFGAPLLMGLLGVGLGILYNYAQDA